MNQNDYQIKEAIGAGTGKYKVEYKTRIVFIGYEYECERIVNIFRDIEDIDRKIDRDKEDQEDGK